MWAGTRKTMLITTNDTSDTLSTYTATQTIYWNFGTTLSTNKIEICAGKSE